jgi:uroporphyrinogen decarboxylase
MLKEQWETFKRAARGEKMDKIPMALIVDSPWIPGYLGIKHMDYYLDPELWFESNLKIMREFPDIIFIPSWWMEYGMAAEPSVLGAKIKFWQDNTPSEYHTLYRLEDIDNFPEYEVEADAFAALTLHRIGMIRQRILDHGYILPMVTAPLHDRHCGRPERCAPVDRPVHPRDHRLAEGAAQGDGRHGGEHLYSGRHCGLHQ